jgi:hypothetical protein
MTTNKNNQKNKHYLKPIAKSVSAQKISQAIKSYIVISVIQVFIKVVTAYKN